MEGDDAQFVCGLWRRAFAALKPFALCTGEKQVGIWPQCAKSISFALCRKCQKKESPDSTDQSPSSPGSCVLGELGIEPRTIRCSSNRCDKNVDR